MRSNCPLVALYEKLQLPSALMERTTAARRVVLGALGGAILTRDLKRQSVLVVAVRDARHHARDLGQHAGHQPAHYRMLPGVRGPARRHKARAPPIRVIARLPSSPRGRPIGLGRPAHRVAGDRGRAPQPDLIVPPR